MAKFYVSAKISKLDIGSEIEADNPFMAAIEFNKCYSDLLKDGASELVVTEVEEVENDK